MMRLIAILVSVLGLAALVFGIVFITQASSAEQQIAGEIQPVKLAEVDAKYEAAKKSQAPLRAAEEPNIQAGKAAPSAMYNYLSGQRTSLGLAKANIGVAGFVRMSGIIDIIVGLGLVLAGWGLFKKAKA
jgi:cytochrome bd-type quinol oxidase subunit 1